MRIAENIARFGPVLGIIGILTLAGCEEEGAAEKAGKKIDKAGQEIGKSVDEMKKNLGK